MKTSTTGETQCTAKHAREELLFSKHSKKQSKLAQRRLEHLRVQLSTCQSTPKINKTYRFSTNTLKEVKKHAKPTQVQNIAALLRHSEKTQPSSNEFLVKLTNFSVSFASDQKSVEYVPKPEFETSQGISYVSIKHLMESTSPKPQPSKQKKPNKKKTLLKTGKNQKAENDGCFSPTDKTNFPKNGKLSLSPKYLSYPSGLNFAEFRKKAKPVVSYQALGI